MMPTSGSSTPIAVGWGKHQVEVSTVDRSLPDASVVQDRNKLVKAGLHSPLAALPEDAWRAVARAATTPESVALQLRESQSTQASVLLEEHVDGATLRSVHARVWLSELFPAIQPRMGQEILGVEDPQVQGVTEDGKSQAILRYRYRDIRHLRSHVWQTIWATLSRNSYEESILARRVTRALIVHPVIYEFEDGSESICALVARDGITRLASAWKVLAGPDKDPGAVATLAEYTLFAELRFSGNENPKPLTQRMALAREGLRKGLRDEFDGEMVKSGADAPLSLRAIQIAQSFVVPAHITVGAEAHERTLLNAADVFDDALRSVLASVHVEFKPWDSAAQNVEVASRALKRVLNAYSGSSLEKARLQAVYELAIGRRNSSEIAQVYGDTSTPGTGLWRAVRLLYTLTRPVICEELKMRAKEIKGDRRMTDKGYAGLLGPIVDHPWRSSKKAAAQQARNAWSNGGVIFKEVLQDGWAPIVTDDFTTLVEPALKGSRDARMTLALAGGTALIADKLLTRNVGSTQSRTRAPGRVPFRSDVHKVVEGLARDGNALGLWTLALAAQRFQDGRLPYNTGTMEQLGLPGDEGVELDGEYRHFVVDLEASDRIYRVNGKPVMLLEWDVVVASDQERARQALAVPTRNGQAGVNTDVATDRAGGSAVQGEASEEDDEDIQRTAVDTERPIGQRISEVCRMLTNHLGDARVCLDELERLGKLVTFPPLLGTFEQWRETRETILHILTAVQNHEGDYPDNEEEEM